jgi:hypothetical protein
MPPSVHDHGHRAREPKISLDGESQITSYIQTVASGAPTNRETFENVIAPKALKILTKFVLRSVRLKTASRGNPWRTARISTEQPAVLALNARVALGVTG